MSALKFKWTDVSSKESWRNITFEVIKFWPLLFYSIYFLIRDNTKQGSTEKLLYQTDPRSYSVLSIFCQNLSIQVASSNLKRQK